MCGIAGIANLSSGAKVSGDDLRLMTERLRHRGPDDETYLYDGCVGLGFRRLSIIDLAGGAQPMANEDGAIHVIFNGEIYNFRSIRTELQARGHHFRTRSDSEVIVHAYEDFGTEFLSRLDGMFAIALWDARSMRLLLARDRLGKKPLVYSLTTGGIVFASEIAALLALPAVSREVDLSALADYMILHYVPSPKTIFRNVRKIPAGHYMLLESGRQVLAPYWQIRYEPDTSISNQEAASLIREGVTSAVRSRLVSDVPLGAMLSGGIDSSIVVAAMSEVLGDSLETFSIGFSDAEMNELPYARAVAKRFHTRHHEFVVESDCVEALDDMVLHFGEPFADSSAVPTYFLAREVRRFVTVALSGDGGDEVFAGYQRYRAAMRAHVIDGFPSPVRKAGAAVAHLANPTEQASRLEALLSYRDFSDRYSYWITAGREAKLVSLYSDTLKNALAEEKPYQRYIRPWLRTPQVADPLNKLLLTDTMTYLPDDLLVKMDISSMSHSLEVRSPFLDHHVVELAARLPPAMKLRGRIGKYMLRKAFADVLLPESTDRPKMGFSAPIARWFRETSLAEMTRDRLLGSQARSRDYFRMDALELIIREHMSGTADHSAVLWSLIVLETWHEKVVSS